MIDFGKLKGEYTALAYLVMYAERARDVLRRAAVSGSTFTDDACRAAFLALMRETTNDDAHLLGVVQHNIPALKDNATSDAFLGLAASSGALEYEAVRFAERAIMREHVAEMQRLQAQHGDQQAEFLMDMQQRIIDGTKARIDALRTAFPLSPQDAAEEKGGASGAAIDGSLLHVPGFIDRMVEYSMLTAQRPNRVLSFAGALALLAHLAGRRFVGPNDARPNIYLIALADSGTGKDAPRKLNRRIALDERIEISVQNDIGSGQGLEDALKRTPALLMQMDEFDTVLNVMKDEKGNRQTSEAMWKVLLTMFSSSGSDYSTRLKAENARGGGGGEIIYSPSLTIFATAVTSKFYGSLCERALTNGFLARCLVFEANERGEYNPTSGISKTNTPNDIRRMVRDVLDCRLNMLGNNPVDLSNMEVVPYADDGAAEEVKNVNRDADALYDRAKRDGDDMEKAVWCRSVELTLKFALLYAISEGLAEGSGFAISKAAVSWAWRLVKTVQLRMLDMVRENTAANPLDEKVQKVLKLVRQAGKKGIQRGSLLRDTHLSSRELDEIETTLLEREEITAADLPRGRNGKPAKLYIAVKGNSRKGA